MPVQPCSTIVKGESRPGRRWGESGTCYPCSSDGDCTEADGKAKAQGRAIKSQQAAERKEKAVRASEDHRTMTAETTPAPVAESPAPPAPPAEVPAAPEPAEAPVATTTQPVRGAARKRGRMRR